MKDLVKDKDGKICAAKIAYWLTLVICLTKVVIQDAPDYSGLALLIGSVGAVYFGRNHTKASK